MSQPTCLHEQDTSAVQQEQEQLSTVQQEQPLQPQHVTEQQQESPKKFKRAPPIFRNKDL